MFVKAIRAEAAMVKRITYEQVHHWLTESSTDRLDRLQSASERPKCHCAATKMCFESLARDSPNVIFCHSLRE